MSRGMPSMVALLGLLAVAGYQNRDKLAGMLGGGNQGAGAAPGQGSAPAGQGGMLGGLGGLGGLLGGASTGSVLSGGLGQLIDRFRQAGHGPAADSWVNTGPNQPIQTSQLEQAIGPDVMEQLQQHTGLSRDELLSRLSKELPNAVDKMTPQGRLPTEDEAGRLI